MAQGFIWLLALTCRICALQSRESAHMSGRKTFDLLESKRLGYCAAPQEKASPCLLILYGCMKSSRFVNHAACIAVGGILNFRLRKWSGYISPAGFLSVVGTGSFKTCMAERSHELPRTHRP